MKTVGEFLARLGGADLDVLQLAPRARDRFVQMGTVLLSTAGLAVVSMSFALADAVQMPVGVSISFGLGWGFIILNLDRLLIQNMDVRTSLAKTLLMITPRIMMAMLLGAVISTPLVLRVFEHDIEARMVEVNAVKQTSLGGLLDRTADSVELERVRSDIATNEGILRGNVPGLQAPALTAALTDVQSAETDYQQKLKTSNDLYERMQCELYGSRCRSASGRHGSGPLYQALKQEYATAMAQTRHAAANLARAQKSLDDAREAAIAANTEAVKNAQDQANSMLPGLRAKAAELQARVDERRAAGSTTMDDNVGLLSRIGALSDLGSNNFSERLSHLAVAGLFFMIELLPILVKVMSLFGPKSVYERMREMEDGALLDRAKVQRNESRRRLEVETRKRRDIEDDMRTRERDLGLKANVHVAGQMEAILDVALEQWSQDVARTLARATPPNSAPPAAPTAPIPAPASGDGATGSAAQRAQQTVRNSFNLPNGGNL